MSSNHPLDPWNPYRQPAQREEERTVEHRDTTETVLLDPQTGTALRFPQTSQEAVIEDATGNRVFRQITTLVTTVDGEAIKDAATEGLYACRVCRAFPISRFGVRRCAECGGISCLACTRTTIDETTTTHRCRPCTTAQARERLHAWFFSVS